MVFACDTCHFVFSNTQEPEQCPDCGKYTVRLATDEEKQELNERMVNKEQNQNW